VVAGSRVTTHADEIGAWAALLRTHAALVPRMSRRVQQATGLPLTWYDVLLELNAAPGKRLTMQQLGEVVVLSRSRASRVVDELAGAGLVRRDPHPDDRRSAFAVLTDTGRAALRRAAPVYLASIREEFASRLSAADLHRLRRILEKLLADTERWPSWGAGPQTMTTPPARATPEPVRSSGRRAMTNRRPARTERATPQ
jgi:DNA-binding MarR family transcriptional regulator